MCIETNCRKNKGAERPRQGRPVLVRAAFATISGPENRGFLQDYTGLRPSLWPVDRVDVEVLCHSPIVAEPGTEPWG